MIACTSDTPVQKLQGYLVFSRKQSSQKILDFVPASSGQDIPSGGEDAWLIKKSFTAPPCLTLFSSLFLPRSCLLFIS